MSLEDTNKTTLLIIDDSSMDRKLLKHLIKRKKVVCNVVEAENGAEGLTILRSDNPLLDFSLGIKCVILLDINMPEMNGFEFLEAFEQIRTEKNLTTAMVEIIMCSGSNSPVDKARALEYVLVSDFVEKPISIQRLRSIVDEAPLLS